ncbi:DUF3515 domain-containing protein [Streptomyces sp. NPDC001205]
MTLSRRRPLLVLPAVAVSLAAAGCSSTDAPAAITVPTPPAKVASQCAALHKLLPAKVSGLDRNDPSPTSDLTAGWGDGPAIVLRCGVPKPAAMSDPQKSQNGVELSGVTWLPERLADGGYRATTALREAYVEVTVAAKYGSEIGALNEFGDAVKKAIPEGIAPN